MRRISSVIWSGILSWCAVAQAGEVPGPAPDELLKGSFEGVGQMRSFVSLTGIAVSGDGLPILLQDDFDNYYLAKCSRLDCATGVTREFVATLDNRARRGRLSVGSDGLPILIYWDRQLNAARFDHCNDQSCSDRNTETISVGEMQGADIAIGLDGFPIIALQQTFSPRNILMIKCNDLECDEQAPPVVVGDSASNSKITMALDNDGLPVIAFIDAQFPSPGTITRDLTVVHCEDVDCSGVMTAEIIDVGPLFELGGPADSTISIAIPPDANPILVANLNITGGSRVAFIACNTNTCDDYEEPENLGAGTSYFAELSVGVSSDGLPMMILDEAASSTAMEFVQCQDADCSGTITRTRFSPEAVGQGSFPVITVAADGNPLIGFYRGSDNGYGIVHCKDPECVDWRTY